MKKTKEKSPLELQRLILFVPILHAAVELGSMQNAVEKISRQASNQNAWAEKQRAIEEIWQQINNLFDNLQLPFEKVKLYQDGLPICSFEEKIVAELAQNGSPNHRILQKLIDKGATLLGTESPALLRREYDLQKQLLTATDAAELAARQNEMREQLDSLLNLRDEFIVQRINETLQTDEIGILFLGLQHSVAGKLAPDICLRPLVNFNS